MEARAGIRQFRRLNDLARGGTITHSVAFRNIPGPSVPPQKTPPTEDGRGRNSSGRSVATVPSLIYANIREGEFTPNAIRRQSRMDAMCSRPPEQTRAINCSRTGGTLPHRGFPTRQKGHTRPLVQLCHSLPDFSPWRAIARCGAAAA